MTTVEAAEVFAGTVHDAERCWYETARWPQWVDGLERVVEVTGEWPREGSQLIWQSGPAGRGRVRELVREFEPLVGQTVLVEDESLTGTQRVTFDPSPDGVRVQLSLEYAIKRRTPLTPLIDRLFVRRLMAMSLSKTLQRFGPVLADSRRPGVG